MKRILQGDDPTTISSSGTEDDDSTDEEKEKEAEEEGDKPEAKGQETATDRDAVADPENQTADSPLSLAADDLDNNLHPPQPPPPPPDEEEEMEEEEEGEVDDDDDDDNEDMGEEDIGGVGSEDMADALFPEVEQDKMDLLELEMRARAIKAMLALHEQREKSQKKTTKKK